jgi:hypothetical protein
MLSERHVRPLAAVYAASATIVAPPTLRGVPVGNDDTAFNTARSRSLRGATAAPVSLASAAARGSTAGREEQPPSASMTAPMLASSIQERPMSLAQSFGKQLPAEHASNGRAEQPFEGLRKRPGSGPQPWHSGPQAVRLAPLRPVVRGVCAWYEAVHVAKAAASCRYRIGHFVEFLAGVDVVIAGRLPPRVMTQCRTLFCLRPLVTSGLKQVLSRVQARGVTLVADYDDLLFAGDVSGLPESAGGALGAATKRARLGGYASGLSVFDKFTVSTRALAAQLKRLAPDARVTVVPNGLSEAWLTQGRALYRPYHPGDPKVIRYFAGSPSHDRDFAGIADPLARFLEAHREVRLEVVGPVSFDPRRFPVGRVAALPPVSYDSLPGMLASTWVNLAPLEPTAFNACKSALKVLESGAFGCPTLASPSDDVLRHTELGAPTLLCRSADDWYGGLVAMLDPDRRTEYGRGMADHVAAHGMARSSLPAWLSGLGLECVS